MKPMRQWDPERIIEPPEALRLIQEQFPQLNAEKIFLLGAGWDNSAFLINEEFIFRFPRREIALPLLEAEWCLLPNLAPRLPLLIPIPKWKGKTKDNWPFVGYRALPGFTGSSANLSEEERIALAIPIGHFLKALHGTPNEISSHCLTFGDNESRVNAEILIPKIEKNLEELATLGLFEKKFDLSHSYRLPKATAIVHGDFYVKHLLVDEKHHLCGVIDWGDIHFGDLAIDIAIAHSFLPPEAHTPFRQAYGQIDPETWALARVRALYVSSLFALYGYHSGEPDLLREGIRGLNLN